VEVIAHMALLSDNRAHPKVFCASRRFARMLVRNG